MQFAKDAMKQESNKEVNNFENLLISDKESSWKAGSGAAKKSNNYVINSANLAVKSTKNSFTSFDKCLNSSYSTLHTYLTSQHNNNKRRKTEPVKLAPITFIDLKVKREKDMYATFKALLDSGASCTLASEEAVCHLKKAKSDVTSFKLAAGNFSTYQKCCTKITFAKFNPTAEITNTVHVTKTLSNYNIIIGRDLLHELGINIKFSTKIVRWNDVKINIKKPTCTKEDLFNMEEELFVSDKTDHIVKN